MSERRPKTVNSIANSAADSAVDSIVDATANSIAATIASPVAQHPIAQQSIALKMTPETLPTMTPTIVIGIGGTGLEVLSRVRRMVQESYGGLEQLSIAGFLHIDTDPQAAIAAPSMAGAALDQAERHWAGVSLDVAQQVAIAPDEFPWFHHWLPTELIQQPELLESPQGTRGVRAAGRFAFFWHYEAIRSKCLALRDRLRQPMQHSAQDAEWVVTDDLNIFIVASTGGGTGSGMWIDLGYSLREWFKDEPNLATIAIAPYPDLISDATVNDRVQANSYATLMELNYFSDASTHYSVFYRSTESSSKNAPGSYRIEDWRSPFDFTYLVGASNRQGIGLKPDTVREMIAQNIFLDLAAAYAPYKQSLRRTIQTQIGDRLDLPAQGRSYPRQFMSFGIATIEIPVHQIRTSLAARLAADLYRWWLNVEIPLSGNEIRQTVAQDLQAMQLFGKDLRLSLCQTETGRSLQQIVQQWVQDLELGMGLQNWLHCTAQLPNLPMFAKETGNIVDFMAGYLQPKVEQFRWGYFENDLSMTDSQGYFVTQMRQQRDRLMSQITARLQARLYDDLTNRDRGPKYLQFMLKVIDQLLLDEIIRNETEADAWAAIEQTGNDEYEAACFQITEYQQQWMATKQDWMERQAKLAIAAQGKALQALLERKCRAVAIETLRHLQRVVTHLRWQLHHWLRRVARSEVTYRERANHEANVNVLELVGLKLFQRQELERLYADFIQLSLGTDTLCQIISDEVLQASDRSGFWNAAQQPDTAPFRLLDLEKLSDADYPDLEQIINQVTLRYIEQAPPLSKLYLERDACTRFAKLYPDVHTQQTQTALLFNCSRPLVQIDRQALMGRFDCVEVAQAAIVGGVTTAEPAAQQQAQILQKYFKGEASATGFTIGVAPLSDRERHKVFAVHEMGGFSLRCVAGMENLRFAYQQWYRQKIAADRSRLSDEKLSAPIPLHIQNRIIFWDFMPADPLVERLVVIAQALDILWEEFNQSLQQTVIQYARLEAGDSLRIILASSWEEAVQVLELPDCEADRQSIQQQIDDRLSQASTDADKQALRQKLELYLQQKFPNEWQKEWQKNGDAHPLYLRQKSIVEKFIVGSRLGS